ncbi:MAG: glycoside hydrolase family 3 protein [Oligoflexales bacterium]
MSVLMKPHALKIYRLLMVYGICFLYSPTNSAAGDLPAINIEKKINSLLSQMSLDEKIGQMTQVNKLTIDKNLHHIKELYIGSILSGGGESPKPNSPESWAKMTRLYQQQATQTRLGIPLIYGIDAVHGHANVYGAVVFPHNIGLGASRDPKLIAEIGKITSKEIAATGIHWNFAPAVSVARNLRWGRTYEGFSEDTNLVRTLSRAYASGLNSIRTNNGAKILGTAKHFVGDGGTIWGSSHNSQYKIDQGDTPLSEQELRRIHLPPYIDLIEDGIQSVMVSYSSWNRELMHRHSYLIQDVLKGELGFDGLVVSDWLGVYWQDGEDDAIKIENSINAGIDMVMAVDRYADFIRTLKNLVVNGRVPLSRIDDSVKRILRVKHRIGLFTDPFYSNNFLDEVGSTAHRKVAREAVSKSAVLLKNENVLPLSGKNKSLLIAGKGANNMGLQCGGWTINWQGGDGNITPGHTFLNAMQTSMPTSWSINYLENPQADSEPGSYDYGIVVVAEDPYAEGFGDKQRPQLKNEELALIAQVKAQSKQTILLIYSGRPIEIMNAESQVDAIIAAWLPGSEGLGLSDVILGHQGFTAKLPYAWPKSFENYQGYPIPKHNIMYPFGFGIEVLR